MEEERSSGGWGKKQQQHQHQKRSWKCAQGKMTAREAQVHAAVFGGSGGSGKAAMASAVVDSTGRSLVNIKERRFVFPAKKTQQQKKKKKQSAAAAAAEEEQEQAEEQAAVSFVAVTIAAAVTDGRGNRARRQFGPDDATYARHPHLRRLVPRCFCCVFEEDSFSAAEDDDDDGGDGRRKSIGTLVGQLRGMPKFSGLDAGEEDTAAEGDDANPSAGMATTGKTGDEVCDRRKIRQATAVLRTQKANGKSAAATVIRARNGRAFFVLGSKNTHVLADAEDDPAHRLAENVRAAVLAANGGKPLPLVEEIAEALQRQLAGMGAESNRARLLELLEANTLVGEFEDGMHLIPLAPGDSADIRWFALVPKEDFSGDSAAATTTTTTFSGDRYSCLQTLAGLGLRTVPFSLHPMSELFGVLSAIRHEHHTEGAVLDFLREVPSSSPSAPAATTPAAESPTGELHDDGCEEEAASEVAAANGGRRFIVLETVKFKSVWYVLTRSVREILKGLLSPRRMSAAIAQREAEVNARIATVVRARSADFLHLSEAVIERYLALYRRFVRWYVVERRCTAAEIGAEGMGAWWWRFLEETKTDDFIDSGDLDIGAIRRSLESASSSPSPQAKSAEVSVSEAAAATTTTTMVVGPVRVLVTLHGIPGDGKSRRAGVLAERLRAEGVSVETFEQDAVGGDRDASLDAFVRGIAGDDGDRPRVAILARCNAERGQYVRYVEAARAQGFHVVGVMAEEAASAQMAVVSIAGVLGRDAAAHGTMNRTDDASRAQYVMITLSFRARFKAPRVGMGMDVDDLVTFQALRRPLFELPRAAAVYLDEMQEEVRRAPFHAEDVSRRPIAEIVECLGIGGGGSVGGVVQEARVPAEEVVDTVLAPRLLSMVRTSLAPRMPEPLYIGVLVPRAVRATLMSIARDVLASRGIITTTTTTSDDAAAPAGGDDARHSGSSSSVPKIVWHAHHMTLIHKRNAGDKSEVWADALHAMCTRRRLRLRVRSLVVGSSSGTAVGVVDILDQNDGPDGDAARLVASGVPHVTVCIPEGTRAAASAGFVASASPEAVVALSAEQAASLTWVGCPTGLCR